MSHTGPLTPGAPHVWTLPPGTDFLGSLARTLATETGLAENPEALADALIYVPNRRSARALALAFHQAGGGRTILPPEIRALGDLELEDPPSGAEEALADLGPVLPIGRRLGVLARLVMAFYAQRGLALPPSSAIAAAQELSRLLDSAALAGGADWQNLPELVADADLAAHWRDSVDFLRIVTEIWPQWREEAGATDPYERRLMVAEAIAADIRANPPAGPFIIAGSTGATPSSRVLMQAAQASPKGLVILPGLDRSLSRQRQTIIAETADHPQSSLSRTLLELNLSPNDIPIWPDTDLSDSAAARQKLIQESLAPAAETADWLDRLDDLSAGETISAFATKALSGLSLVEAADTAEEALFAALALREALETKGQTAALITPGATLARQVSALLKRWDIHVAPSGGIPLGRTEPGAFMQLALSWAQDTGDPVALMALLKHPLIRIDKAALSRFERNHLRGPRHWGDLADLIARCPVKEEAKVLAPFAAYAEAAQCFADTSTPLSGPDAVATLIRLIDALTEDESAAWSGAAGEAAARCLEHIAELTEDLPTLTASDFSDILKHIAAAEMVRDTHKDHPRLAIWAPLEARLQYADRIILAGLNEGVWPAQPAANAFLPRKFQAALGLPPPEVRLGLAAHDFAQLASSPDVLLLYAARREDAPALASRWLLRLQTLAEGALGSFAHAALSPLPERDPRPWADALRMDQQDTNLPSARPLPRPPVTARPNTLSVTRINTLQRDPYAIYAGTILRLKKLDALDEPMDARPRGIAVHAALEAFESLPAAQQSTGHLHRLLLEKLKHAGQPAHLVLAESASLARAAAAYITWRDTHIRDRLMHWEEASGRMELQIAGLPFTLTGIADSVQKNTDGQYVIVDFKTGAGKTRKEIDAGFEQQLPLLAAMLRAGHMRAIPAGPVRDFGYVSVRYRFEAPQLTHGMEDANGLADQALDTLSRLIEAYRSPDAPYLSVPRVQLRAAYIGEFDRLARRAEWAGDTSDA